MCRYLRFDLPLVSTPKRIPPIDSGFFTALNRNARRVRYIKLAAIL